MCQFNMKRIDITTSNIQFDADSMNLTVFKHNNWFSINSITDINKFINSTNNAALLALLSLIVELNHAKNSSTQWFYDFSNVINFRSRVNERFNYLASLKTDDDEYISQLRQFRSIFNCSNDIELILNQSITHSIELYNLNEEIDSVQVSSKEQLNEKMGIKTDIKSKPNIITLNKSKLMVINGTFTLLLIIFFMCSNFMDE